MTEKEKEYQGNLLNNRGWELQEAGHADQAIPWYQKAIAYGNTTAMINLGNIYEDQED